MQKYNAVLSFLREVDYDFPVPVSSKTELSDLAEKYCKYGTLCCEYIGNRVLAMVAGYTENTPGDLGYISLVATCRESRGTGLASKLIKEFLLKASDCSLKGVHVYTHCNNVKAINMYQKLGFVPYHPEVEPRPQDIHLIYWITDNCPVTKE